jgi:hypothetical protein
MKIKKNIGIPDRIARIVMGIIALAIIPLAFIGPKTPLAYLGFLGIIPIIAGIVGFCPPYALLGINTYMKRNSEIETCEECHVC